VKEESLYYSNSFAERETERVIERVRVRVRFWKATFVKEEEEEEEEETRALGRVSLTNDSIRSRKRWESPKREDRRRKRRRKE